MLAVVQSPSLMIIGVDLAGILRGTHGERRRWVGAERGGVWWGVSPLQPTRRSGGTSWAHPAGTGQSPRRKRILAYFEDHMPQNAPFCIYDKNLRGTICTSVPPTPHSGGLVPRVAASPRDLVPCWWSTNGSTWLSTVSWRHGMHVTSLLFIFCSHRN